VGACLIETGTVGDCCPEIPATGSQMAGWNDKSGERLELGPSKVVIEIR
jgi:hypothetical protein